MCNLGPDDSAWQTLNAGTGAALDFAATETVTTKRHWDEKTFCILSYTGVLWVAFSSLGGESWRTTLQNLQYLEKLKSILIEYAHICTADISTYLGQDALEIQREPTTLGVPIINSSDSA